MFMEFTVEKIKNTILKSSDINITWVGKNKKARYGIDILLHRYILEYAKTLMEKERNICKMMVCKIKLRLVHQPMRRQCYKCRPLEHIMTNCKKKNQNLSELWGDRPHRSRIPEHQAVLIMWEPGTWNSIWRLSCQSMAQQRSSQDN